MENVEQLVSALLMEQKESPWLEFKSGNFNPEMIGEDISAIANGVTLSDRSCGYMLWGVENDTRKIVAAKLRDDFRKIKKGGQELENWLRQMLSRNADIEWATARLPDGEVGVLKIDAARSLPVTFQKNGYVRIGSYTKKLNEYPAVEAKLWDKLRIGCFEKFPAMEHLALSDALSRIDYVPYFDQRALPIPSDLVGVAHFMVEEGILKREDSSLYSITNMGAIMLAKRLSDFPSVARKAIRVVQYEHQDRMNILREVTIDKGYLTGLEETVKLIRALVPTREDIGEAFRVQKTAYPTIAIRETVVNSLIHQDFTIHGTGPVVEIFSDCIEISNSGLPLVDVKRIVDSPPKSRNEKMASYARRVNMCEELGSGWDRIVESCEFCQLPTPTIHLYEDCTKVIIYSNVPFANQTNESRLWALYMHACVKHTQRSQLTNASLRTRFGLKPSSAGMISRLIKTAVQKRLIKVFDESASLKFKRYVPWWA